MKWLANIFVGLALVIYACAWLYYPIDKLAINVRSIEVLNNVSHQGDEILLGVDREIHADFEGRYEVVVRDLNKGHVYCTTGPVHVPYRRLRPDGELTRLPIPLTLAYWAGGGNCVKNIQPLKGGPYVIPPGKYSVTTCHTVLNAWVVLPPVRTCWESIPIFVVLPSKLRRRGALPLERDPVVFERVLDRNTVILRARAAGITVPFGLAGVPIVGSE